LRAKKPGTTQTLLVTATATPTALKLCSAGIVFDSDAQRAKECWKDAEGKLNWELFFPALKKVIPEVANLICYAVHSTEVQVAWSCDAHLSIAHASIDLSESKFGSKTARATAFCV
jgi:hypothetical protein